MGDALVKHGDVAVARVAYHDAQLVKDYLSWPYKSELEERLAADLNAREALYDDADPSNDPPIFVANASCTGCHATSAPK
jgi:hypothetical protein